MSLFGVMLVQIFLHSDWLRISPYSVRMRANADQKNPEYGHFSHGDFYRGFWFWYFNFIRCMHFFFYFEKDIANMTVNFFLSFGWLFLFPESSGTCRRICNIVDLSWEIATNYKLMIPFYLYYEPVSRRDICYYPPCGKSPTVGTIYNFSMPTPKKSAISILATHKKGRASKSNLFKLSI